MSLSALQGVRGRGPAVTHQVPDHQTAVFAPECAFVGYIRGLSRLGTPRGVLGGCCKGKSEYNNECGTWKGGFACQASLNLEP
jgi:hypothetical protein